MTRLVRLLALASLSMVAACAALFGSGKSTAPEKPRYTPSWSYRSTTPASEKTPVTIGIVNPQFVGDGERYHQEQKDDQAVKDMLRALRTSVPELLVAKGVTTAGPYDRVSALTYPEKKGSDFIFYEELDLTATYEAGNIRQEKAFMSNALTTTCTITLGLSGSVQVVLDEPMSGQRMWVKRIPVEIPNRSYQGRDIVCAKQAITPEIRDAWFQIHETLYRQVMAQLDRYLNAEELVVLKAQADELKGKKSF